VGPFTTTLIALAQLSFDGGGGGEKLFLPYKTSEEKININKTAKNLEQNKALFELISHLKKNMNSLFKNEKQLCQFNPLKFKAKKISNSACKISLINSLTKKSTQTVNT